MFFSLMLKLHIHLLQVMISRYKSTKIFAQLLISYEIIYIRKSQALTR